MLQDFTHVAGDELPHPNVGDTFLHSPMSQDFTHVAGEELPCPNVGDTFLHSPMSQDFTHVAVDEFPPPNVGDTFPHVMILERPEAHTPQHPSYTTPYQKSKKFCQHRFSDITNKLEDATETEKDRILQKLCLSNEMNIFIKSNVKYLKALVCNAKRSNASKLVIKKVLREIYCDYLDDFNFLVWLAKLLQTSCAFLSFVLAHEDTMEKPGRKMTSVNNRQDMHDFWKANSDVSVHRSNNRHIVKILKKNLKKQVTDLADEFISEVTTKRGEKKKAHRRITTEPYYILHILMNLNLHMDCS